MIQTSREYDWQTREDADTLARANAIQKDPQRQALARECLSSTIADCKRALGKEVPSTPSRRNNKATVGRPDISKL